MDETKYVSGWHHVPFINLQLRTRVLVIVSILAVATFYSSREAFSLNESSLENILLLEVYVLLLSRDQHI
jgi:hypothetical protein